MNNPLRYLSSLSAKFTLIAVSSLIATIIFVSLIIFDREKKLYIENTMRQANTLLEISQLLLTNIMVYNELGIMDNHDMSDFMDYFIVDLLQKDVLIQDVSIMDDKGYIFAHSDLNQYGKQQADNLFQEVMDTNKILLRLADNDTLLSIAPLSISTKQWGAIKLNISLEEMYSSINELKQSIVIFSVIIVFISVVIIRVAAKRLSRPILQLAERMDKIQHHEDLEKSIVYLRRNDEIGRLQDSFVWLLRRLQESDIERQNMIEQLSQNERLVSLGHLSAGIAHEINTPLGGIMICMERLKKQVKTNIETEELSYAINDSLQKIKQIVEQLLDFSRVSKNELTETNLCRFLDDVLLLLKYEADRRHIAIEIDCEINMPYITIDRNKISQVIMNIIINAFHAMPSGGTLQIRAFCNNHLCILEFSDTGTGIPKSIMPFIFDPFYTTKDVGVGTGLGLSVSKGIIEAHGGSINVSSTEGAGTVFTVKLPMQESNNE